MSYCHGASGSSRGVYAQATDALGRMRALLAEAGSGFEHVVRTWFYLGGITGLERDFVKVAKAYSAKKGISYGAWREFGVSPEVLKKAGISRST